MKHYSSGTFISGNKKTNDYEKFIHCFRNELYRIFKFYERATFCIKIRNEKIISIMVCDGQI